MKKKKNLFYYLKKDRFIYLLMLPGLIWYLVFRYFPMLGIVIAFEDYKPFWGIEGIFTSNWVGFKHFIKFFQSPYFFRLMKNTLLLSIYTLVWSFAAFPFHRYRLRNDPNPGVCGRWAGQCDCEIFRRRGDAVSRNAGIFPDNLHSFRSLAERRLGQHRIYRSDGRHRPGAL